MSTNMGDGALISVVIPVYNGERYLAEAIQSVLAQSCRPLEVIVVDDGSTDGSARIAAQFAPQVRYESQARAGAGAARNHGVSISTGVWIAFLDADDRWTADKLALQAAALKADPALDAVFGHIEQFYSPDFGEAARSRTHCPPARMPGYSPCTILIRRSAFLRVGPFDPDCRAGEFIDWFVRAMEIGLRTKMLPDVVAYRRIHDANQGIREPQSAVHYVRIARAVLKQRRAALQQEGAAGQDFP